MKRYVAVVVLLGMVLGLAHLIETQARPKTGRTGVHVGGEHVH